MTGIARELAAVASALGVYQARVLPLVGREQQRWRLVAEAIPDPVLRGHAVAALEDKAANVEATAVFAILAPRPARATAIRAMAALQIAIDYLDTLGEQEVEEPLENGLRLHRSLVAALTPGAEPGDWYRFHPQSDDGGYLASLIGRCQDSVAVLPSAAAILPLAQRAARRCGEGQSYTHAAGGDVGALERWAVELEGPPGYRWWEVAAGACSSVAAHALIAAAADPGATAAEGELIAAAYFPPAGALTVLLDDLVDLDEDVASGEHNYVSYYPSAEAAADSMALIAARAEAATEQLRQRRRHAAILAGIAGFYLSDPGARTPFARPIRGRLLEAFGPGARFLAAALRLRRR